MTGAKTVNVHELSFWFFRRFGSELSSRCSIARDVSFPPSPFSPRQQGLFLAPTIVGESLKGAFLLAEVFGGTFGLPTNPPPPVSNGATNAIDGNGVVGKSQVSTQSAEAEAPGLPEPKGGEGKGEVGGVGGRTDIVQALELGTRDRLVQFCETVQLLSPINAFVKPGETECSMLFISVNAREFCTRWWFDSAVCMCKEDEG